MIFYHIVILALIQGITEFLPISSSGHLVLAHRIFDGAEAGQWGDNLTIDVAVHVGTLFSVLVYFRRDVLMMLRGLTNCFTGTCGSDEAKLLLYVLIGSLPVIIVGYALHAVEPGWIRAIEVIGWTTLIFGIVLWWVDQKSPSDRSLKDMTLRDAVWIGMAQALALIPGVSRSGITMTAARWFGLSRTEAARYSLLLAIVAISGAGALGGIDLIESGNAALTYDALLAAALSFVSGLGAIAIMMKWLERSSFTPFAIYRVILGIALLGLIYSGVLQ